MNMRLRLFPASTAVCALLMGCGAQNLDTFLPTTLDHVDDIRNSTALEPQEMRDQLAALGFDDVTINGLLRAITFGNQFGGTITTAYNKVVNGEIFSLTPDEIQIYANESGAGSFTDDSASKLAAWFADNSITTGESLGTALDDPAIEFVSGLGADTVRAVFVDFDPADLLPSLP